MRPMVDYATQFWAQSGIHPCVRLLTNLGMARPTCCGCTRADGQVPASTRRMLRGPCSDPCQSGSGWVSVRCAAALFRRCGQLEEGSVNHALRPLRPAHLPRPAATVTTRNGGAPLGSEVRGEGRDPARPEAKQDHPQNPSGPDHTGQDDWIDNLNTQQPDLVRG